MILLTALALGLLLVLAAFVAVAAIVLGGLAGLVRAFTPRGHARATAAPGRWERIRRATEGVDSW